MSAGPSPIAHQGTCRVAVDHPAFAGHFPGRPIVPGVWLLAEVVELLRRAGEPTDSLTIAQAKFLAPVGPGAELLVRVWQPEGASGARRFELQQQGQPVAIGLLGP